MCTLATQTRARVMSTDSKNRRQQRRRPWAKLRRRRAQTTQTASSTGDKNATKRYTKGGNKDEGTSGNTTLDVTGLILALDLSVGVTPDAVFYCMSTIYIHAHSSRARTRQLGIKGDRKDDTKATSQPGNPAHTVIMGTIQTRGSLPLSGVLASVG